MPSHVTHLLFAEEMIARLPQSAGRDGLLAADRRPWLALGAQGPDIFYHNQRRRPTGLAYGSLMHRHGYGTAVAHMWEHASESKLDAASWAAAFIVGFTSHAVLDRATHPYINATAGWPDQGDPDTDRFRSMHPFLERLIDVELLRRRRGMHPNELDFFSIVDCGEAPPPDWVALVAAGLRGAYRKATRDELLSERIGCAYLDTMGYYRFTNLVDADYLERGLERAESDDVGRRWLSIVHPIEVPSELDVLNAGHREWCHPCSSHEIHTESFVELYDSALADGAAMTATLLDAWKLDRDAGVRAITEAVTEWNLSDGRPTERPCTKRHASPLPLAELQTRIRDSIRNGRPGRLSGSRD